MKLDKDFWNNRYLDKDTGWDVGKISQPIKDYINQIDDKSLKIIIPGCGNAHEAEYLFNNGFTNVFLIDLSPIALKQFADRVPKFPKEQLICDNFFKHTDEYDLMIEQTFFCAINPQLRSKYVAHSSKILQPKGKIIGLLFDAPLNTNKPPFGGTKKEYQNYFKINFTINKMELAYNSIESRKGRELFINLSVK
ncbi:MAG: methyltransferase domain-containing protein [Vicingaceae bacterium]